MIFSTLPICLRKRERNLANGSIATAAIRNGMPRPERIDREQARALGHRRLRSRDRKDGGEDRADAGRPAERKSEPHHIGAPETGGLCDLGALFAHQPAELECAEEMQPHHDDRDAGHDRQFRRPDPQQSADRTGARAERDEHGRKAEHEQAGREQGLALDALPPARCRQAARATCPPYRRDKAAPAARRRATGTRSARQSGPRTGRHRVSSQVHMHADRGGRKRRQGMRAGM